MEISAADLEAEVNAALKSWPFILDVEKRQALPAYLMFAVGSRETNLRNILGDGGHGRGVWQRDDRWWHIPDPYPVHQQAHDSAALLRSDLEYFHGDLAKGVASYNCGPGAVEKALREGRGPDAYTTGGDYGTEVLARHAYILAHLAK